MNTVGFALSLFFLVCVAGIVLGIIIPRKHTPIILTWTGSLAAALALWAAGDTLISGYEFQGSLWAIPPVGVLSIRLDLG
jgi:hypothetical protein